MHAPVDLDRISGSLDMDSWLMVEMSEISPQTCPLSKSVQRLILWESFFPSHPIARNESSRRLKVIRDGQIG